MHASYKRTHNQNRSQENIVSIWARGIMIGVAMIVVAIGVTIVLNEVLEQRAEQPEDAYTPPAVPKPFDK